MSPRPPQLKRHGLKEEAVLMKLTKASLFNFVKIVVSISKCCSGCRFVFVSPGNVFHFSDRSMKGMLN